MESCPPIAIVGMGGVFPGATELPRFWRNILDGRDMAHDVPADRWVLDPRAALAHGPGPDKVYSLRGCFVEDFALDPTGLAIDPERLRTLDPLYHMVLHAGRRAFEDAEIDAVSPERVGVILAAIALPTDGSSAITREILGKAFERRLFRRDPTGSVPRCVAAERAPHPLRGRSAKAERWRRRPAGGPTGRTPVPQSGYDRLLNRAAGSGSAMDPLNAKVTALPAALLAEALGLGGGCYTLDAACASSFYALKLACDELAEGRADAMLAGGVSRPECLYTQMGFTQLRALSPSGRCSPFDARSDGLLVGEGAGIVLLKRLDDALAAGDTIHGVIRGIGLSNDMGGSLLAPDSEGQLRAMRQAYDAAGWSPEAVDLIECHGTGTPIGDAVEIESLRRLWKDAPWRPGQCPIGSIKSMIGHLLTGAGAAGLIKVMLAMREGTLPPSANFERPGKGAPLVGSPFRVQRDPSPWERRDEQTPRRAAISAFGFGGINAHVLIEEWLPSTSKAELPHRRPAETERWHRRPAGGNTAETPAPQGSPIARELEPVAIVGMSARFGEVASLEAFQHLVLRGETAVQPRPGGRWRGGDAIADEWLDRREMPGAYLRDIAVAVGKYRLPPNEIREILPQQLLMLEIVAAALADANQPLHERRPRTSVIIGMALDFDTTNFHLRWWLPGQARQWAEQLGLDLDDEALARWIAALQDATGPALTASATTGALGGIIASRIARECGFGGPSYAVSCDEASGLRAVEIAARSLQRGEIDTAVVGAVDMAGDLRAVVTSDRLSRHAAEGVARPFDSAADGSPVGEGAAAVVLKRLSDAERDGDRVYALIRGIGDARGGGVASGGTSGDAYRRAVRRACADAKVEPQTLSYIEANGSGDPHEDRVEATALLEHFAGRETPAALGSLKPAIGHCGAAAGLASLVKASLALRCEIIPPMRHMTRPAAGVPWKPDALHSPSEPTYWHRDRRDGPRRAGVSAMTLDGTCMHVVLEGVRHGLLPEPNRGAGVSPAIPPVGPPAGRRRHKASLSQPLGERSTAVFAMEGNDGAGLLSRLSDLAHLQERHPGGIEALALAWFARQETDAGRTRAPLAIGIAASSRDELAAALTTAVDALRSKPDVALNGHRGVFYNPAPLSRRGDVAFVFPGSGNQFIGMGRTIGVHWPDVLRGLDASMDQLQRQSMARWFMPYRIAWEDDWQAEAARAAAADMRRMIFGQVTFGVMMSDLVRGFGVEPNAIIGYSLGESTGLFATRTWADPGEMLNRMFASTLFHTDLAGPRHALQSAWNLSAERCAEWETLLLTRPAHEVREAIRHEPFVRLLIVNTPKECAIGGLREDVRRVAARLRCRPIVVRDIPTVHFEAAAKVEDAYRRMHLFDTTPPSGMRFYSCVEGRAHDVNRQRAAASVTGQALHGFDFTRVIESAYADGVRIFVELGPQASCSRMIGRILEGRPHFARSASLKGEDEVVVVMTLLAALIAERLPVDLSGMYGRDSDAVVETADAPDATRAEIVVPVGGPAPDLEGVLRRFPPRAPVRPHETRPGRAAPPIPSVGGQSPPEPPALPGSVPSRPGVGNGARDFPDREGSSPADNVLSPLAASSASVAKAHEAFLAFSRTATQGLGSALAIQADLLATAAERGEPIVAPHSPGRAKRAAGFSPRGRSCDGGARPLFPREQCMEFAIGSVANVLGPDFAEVDTFPVRVRLPAEPLMLVDRILSIEGEPGSLTSGRIITEHDVLSDAWYLDGGRCPVCTSVEAGQADLFLCSYLGIDLAVRGTRSYRLLDAAVTFHRDLPRPGETIRYDIRIDRFVRRGETHLFFFHYDATIGGEPLMTMRDGCAGFFTAEEIERSGGLVLTADDKAPATGRRDPTWRDLALRPAASYDERCVEALRAGDLAGCFGPAFGRLALRDSSRLPDGLMKLFDRVIELDPDGGRFGLGIIRAESDIQPDDWFLTCHFVDDMTMPGTLMYECCVHTLRFFLLAIGWVGERDGVAYQPIHGLRSDLKCRGPVTQKTRKVVYQVDIKEIGYADEPYVIADALMYADGRRIVQMKDISLRLTGMRREAIESLWRPSVATTQPAFGKEQFLAFATGKPSEAFGEPYRVFDAQRTIARLPGPPYQFVDRVVKIDAAPWKLEPTDWVTTEYEVPADAWYFRANRQASMPLAVLLEIALQPCGWLAAYLGSALHSEADLSFRNLSGTATMVEELFPDAGVVTVRVKLNSVAEAGGMIIERFEMRVLRGDALIYEGETTFGFFSAAALSRQVGIRDAAERLHLPSEIEFATGRRFALEDLPPWTPDDTRVAPSKAAALPSRAFRMLDAVDLLVPAGGPHGLGYIRGSIAVDPDAWFFKAHFHQDPVWPGSLGIESFMQLLKVFALDRWGDGVRRSHRFEPIALGIEHTWNYRGQILPTNRRVEVQAVITHVEDADSPMLKAEGFLSVDGVYIYEMSGFGLRLVPANG